MPLETVGTPVISTWRNALKKTTAASELPALRSRTVRGVWVKQRAPRRPSNKGKRYAAPPIRKNDVAAVTAPTRPIIFLAGGAAADPEPVKTLASPGTKERRLNKISRPAVIRSTPMTSRCTWDGPEEVLRASPRFAVVDTPISRHASIGKGSFQTAQSQ